MKTKLIKIDSLVTENLQVRVSLDQSAISDYAEAMKDGAEFPPVVVFRDAARPESAPYLADGFHRVEAARRAGHDTIASEIREGTFDEALAFALQANDKHGVRRTNDDKRNAMRIAWENRVKLFGEKVPSVRHFAAVCGVSIGNAHAFLNNNVVFKLNTSVNEGGRHGVPTLPAGETVGGTNGHVPDATTVTREHLEERDSSVRAKLKDGKDRYGVDIPERLKGAFLSREPRALVRELNRTYAELERRRMEGDIVFAPFVGFAMTHLDNLINSIRHGMVHCVCRMCRGRGCGSCNNLGFQTKAQYDRNPSEFNREIA